MPKSTDKLTRAQVLKIPALINKGLSVGAVAKLYGVSWQNVWYHIGKLRKKGFEIKTRKRGKELWDIYNGQTLCMLCHRKEEKRLKADGFVVNTRKRGQVKMKLR